MAETDRDLELALEALARESREDLGPHPSPGRWERFVEGSLQELEQAELRSHLALCPECADLVLALRAVSDPPEVEVTAEQEEQAWWHLQQRLGPATEPQRPASGPRSPALRGQWWPLAATFILGAVLGILVWSLGVFQPHVPEATGSEANPRLLELSPHGTPGMRGGDEEAAGVDEPLVFVLNTVAGAVYDELEAELRLGDELVLRRGGLVPRRGGSVTFFVYPQTLSPGTYRIALYGLADGVRELSDEYEVSLNSPSTASP